MNVLAIISVFASFYFEVSDANCGCRYEYKRVGCFKDRKPTRALPKLLLTERDRSSQEYSGYDIDWFNWNTYMPALVCRCAEKAMKKGYKYFGVQFWGECWSGPSPAADQEYNRYGEGSACFGPGYQMCHENDVNCVGDNFHNFVYEIATYKCDVHFEKVGCYNDYWRDNFLALTARDRWSDKYLGEPIDWWNYDIFLPKFACECAKRILDAGYNTFGMQYYGECWTGPTFELKYYKKEGESNNCINKCYDSCKRYDRFCIGKGFTNAVYRITHPNCEMKYENLGCYNAMDEFYNLAMPQLLINNVLPNSPQFDGHLLLFNDTWEMMYKDLLCRCSRAANELGYQHFAIRNKGECWSGPNSGQTYDKFGPSKRCIRKEFDFCEDDDIMCAGDEASINVYKILGREIVTGK